jgi:hypothetical protein
VNSGAVYEWGTGSSVGENTLSPATTTAATRSVAPSVATTYWVRLKGTGACSATITGGVTTAIAVYPVPAPPTMNGGGTHCTGSADITASAGTNGNGIKWDDGSTASARMVTVSGTYGAITTSAAGCTSSTATVVVTIGTGSASGSAPNATCGCASELVNCGSTCKEEGYTYQLDGTCRNCSSRWVRQLTACGEEITAEYMACDDGTCYTSGCSSSTNATCGDNETELPGTYDWGGPCNVDCQAYATAAGAPWYYFLVFNQKCYCRYCYNSTRVCL